MQISRFHLCEWLNFFNPFVLQVSRNAYFCVNFSNSCELLHSVLLLLLLLCGQSENSKEALLLSLQRYVIEGRSCVMSRISHFFTVTRVPRVVAMPYLAASTEWKTTQFSSLEKAHHWGGQNAVLHDFSGTAAFNTKLTLTDVALYKLTIPAAFQENHKIRNEIKNVLNLLSCWVRARDKTLNLNVPLT